MSIAQEHLDLIAGKFEQLQKEGCSILEACDGSGTFSKDVWRKDIGFGCTRVLTEGDKILKGALNYSNVSGRLNDRMSRVLGVNAGEYAATGISSIFHGRNPFVPTIHMNVRYFAFDNGMEWFGGGVDLSPVYIQVEQARSFHTRLKQVCDTYDAGFYPEFKQCADEYFYIRHRDETRGIGGIFFDRQQPSANMGFNRWVEFTTELAEMYPKLYCDLIEANHEKPYTNDQRLWQKIRWGRYAEFNLVYDRGTKFGLESGGNTESILISLPPEVRWEYLFQVKEDSMEAKTQQLLKKGIDWLNITDA